MTKPASTPLATRTVANPDPLGLGFGAFLNSQRDVRDAMIAAGHVPPDLWRVPGGGIHFLPCAGCGVEGRIQAVYPPAGTTYRAYGPSAGRCKGRIADAV